MEGALDATAGRARESGDCQHAQGYNGPPPIHASLNKNLIRKKSVFTLAAEFFKPNKDEKAEIPTLEYEKQQRSKVPRSSFVSLRGFRDSRKRAADFGTARCRSSSPQKSNEFVIGELGTKKTMRRKSLQDLLGTVGTKLSLARRLVYSEDTISQSETPQEAMTETQGISPLVLPEPALPLLRAHNSVFGSLCHFSKDSTSHEVPNSRENVETPRNSECAPTDRPRLRVKPSLRILNGAVQESNMNDRSKPPQLPCMSQELKHVSPSTSPERLSPAVPTDFLRDVSPQLLPRVRFIDEKVLPQYWCSDNFEDTIAAENANLDPSFPARALSREERYGSINGRPTSKRTGLSSEDIGDTLALTAAKTSKNSHLSTTQNRWSVDSSERDTEDTSDYEWAKKEMEVQDTIDRGKDIMTLGTPSPYLHSSDMGRFRTPTRITDSIMDKTVKIVVSHEELPNDAPSQIRSGAHSPHYNSHVDVQGRPTSKEDWMLSTSHLICPMALEEPQPELPSSGNPAMVFGMLQDSDETKAQTISCTVDRGRKRVISLVNGERFRPRRVNSRVVSDEPVHIVYPPNEFSASHTKTYMSKGSAFGDLYQNHSGFSDYCLFDRSTRTYYPQALTDPVPELVQSKDRKLEVLWLPLELFPAASLTGQNDRENRCLSPSNDRVSEVDGSSSCKADGALNLVLDAKKPDTEAFKKGNGMSSSSSRLDSLCSEHDAWVVYPESAPRVDMVRMSHSNYAMAVKTTQEAPGSTTGSLISEDHQSDADDADDSYEIAVDSATARLYLGSLFSSRQSLLSTAEAEVAHSKSADSTLCKLKDAQPGEAKHVKTWIEMEREFLDKFAPGSQMFPSRRRMVAVYEAFKKLKGLAYSSDGEDALYSNDSDSGFQDAPDIEQEKWLEYRDAYMGCSFEHVQDTAKHVPVREERTLTTDSSDVQEGSSQDVWNDTSTTFGTKEMCNESVELSYRAIGPVVKFAAFQDLITGAIVQKPAYPELPTEGISESHSLGGDGRDICQESDVVSLASHSMLGSEAGSETDSTAITMLSGFMFTHYAEELRELPAEGYGEEQYYCEDECDDRSILSALSDRAKDVAPDFSVVGNASTPPPAETPEIDPRVGSDTDQLKIRLKYQSNGLATVMKVQACPPPIRVGLAPLFPGRSTSLNADRSTSAEVLSGWSPSRPGFMLRKRVSTPNKRISSPLTSSSSQKNQAVRCTSPSPSDADTEASENFGQELQRYRRIEEDEKENDLWWTESISYG